MSRLVSSLLCAALSLAAASAAAQSQAPGGDDGRPRLEVDTRLPMGPIILCSFSAVAIAVGAGFGWQAHQDYDNWKQARDAGDPYFQMDGYADDVKAHSITADVLLFGGAAFAVTGAIWWIVAAKRGGRADAEKTASGGGSVAFHPLLGPTQAGAVFEF